MPRMIGKRALVEQLIADGTTHIFGNPGTTEQGFIDSLQEYPQLTFMRARHEGVAVCMADAYARITRRPAFCEVHIAPGLGNALGMMHNAAYRILELNMVEYLDKGMRGRKFVAMDLTEADLRFDRMAESMGVPGRRVENPDELAPALKEALAHDGPSLIDVVMESPVPIP